MVNIDISSYKKLYLETATENCDSILKNCAEALRNPLDASGLRNIHISAHSLRSKSQVMGYPKLGELSGTIEQTAKKFLDQEETIPKDLMQIIKELATEIRTHLKNIKEENEGTFDRRR